MSQKAEEIKKTPAQTIEQQHAKRSRRHGDDMEVDFTPIVDEKLPGLEQLALKSGKLGEALEGLHALEKQTRVGNDPKSTSRVACAIVSICWRASALADLNSNLVLLSKRRGQEKLVIKDMVKEAMTFLDKFPAAKKDDKLTLISTLRTITEGKIFVEIERANLTMILSKIYESEGNKQKAAQLLQEVQVETYGSMEKKEKAEFILEQIRLCIESGDFIRAHLISKKISKKSLADADFKDIKKRFYDLMIEYYLHEGDFMETCRSYQQIYEMLSPTSSKKISVETKDDVMIDDDGKWADYFKLYIIYLVLSPYDNEQSDLLNRVNIDKNLEAFPQYNGLVKEFLTLEIINWAQTEAKWKEEFSKLGLISGERVSAVWPNFRKRVIAHNLRVVAGYYSRIHFKRLSELLNLENEETEKSLAELVVSKSIYAKIDRPKGIVFFSKPRDASEHLNDWSGNISNLLDLVEKTCHLIHREQMVHSAQK